MTQAKMYLASLSLSAWGSDKPLTGSATFRMEKSVRRYEDDNSSTELKLKLGPAQIAKITEACGDSIRELAESQAKAFYQTAAEMTGNLLEAPKVDKVDTVDDE